MRKASMAGTILALLIPLIAASVQAEISPLSGQKICLDPGHGGSAS